MARGLKFQNYKEEGLYYLCSENKGADQLRGNCKADLFSHMQNIGYLVTRLILNFVLTASHFKGPVNYSWY